MQETIDYSTRQDLVEALLDFRKRGVKVEVIGNGRTLRFPEGIDSTAEDEEPDGLEGLDALKKEGEEPEGDSLLGVVQPSPTQEPSEESGATPSGTGSSGEAEPVEGTCSVCKEAALQEQDGTWVHAGDDNHPDQPGEFVPNAPADDEDLIGAPATPAPTKAVKRTRKQS